MKPSKEWTDAERLEVIYLLSGKLRRAASLVGNQEQILFLTDRILFTSHMPAEWLERNRANILEDL